MTETKNKTFNGKLLAAMKEMSNPIKDTSAYKYDYAKLDQLLKIVRPKLQKYGMDVSWRQRKDTFAFVDDGGEVKERTIFVQDLIVFDANEERVLDTRPVDVSMSIQLRGSEETYLRRYSAQDVFALAAEDDDGTKANDAQQEKTAQKPKNGANKPKHSEDADDIEKRIKNGIDKLSELTGWGEEVILTTMNTAKLDTPAKRLEWLTKTYKDNLEEQKNVNQQGNN